MSVTTKHTELFIMTERDLRDQDFLEALPVPVCGMSQPEWLQALCSERPADSVTGAAIVSTCLSHPGNNHPPKLRKGIACLASRKEC